MTDAAYLTRYRALSAVLLLLVACAFGGAWIVSNPPNPSASQALVFVIVGLVSLGLLALAVPAYRRAQLANLEILTRVAVAIGALMVLQRVAWNFSDAQVADASRNLFRMSLAFMPFVYLSAVVVLNPRIAMRACWLVWLGHVAIVVTSLWLHGALDPARPGLVASLVWVLLGNPLFILMLGALPQYHKKLEESAAELTQMRDHATLMNKIADSERRFNLVAQSLEVGVWDWWRHPAEGRWWSPRFYELLGYAPAELPATDENFRSLMHLDDREVMWKLGYEQLKRGEIMDIEFRLKTRHRGYRWFNARAKAERDAEGRLTRIAGAITDIHDQRQATEALRMAQSELSRLAYRDTLTGQYNRRYFDEHFQREWERARRAREPLALIVVDLDHFKAYNDLYGHPLGDRCLTQAAQVLAAAASRSADIVARLGGEEFAIVLPGIAAAGAEEVAQRMRAQLKAAAIPHLGSGAKIVTASIGIAVSLDRNGPSPSEMLEQADKALYEVKRRGRDGVLVYDESLRSGTFSVEKVPAR